METVKVILEEKEIVIPKSDLEWFVKEKGAKEVKESKNNKKEKE